MFLHHNKWQIFAYGSCCGSHDQPVKQAIFKPMSKKIGDSLLFCTINIIMMSIRKNLSNLFGRMFHQVYCVLRAVKKLLINHANLLRRDMPDGKGVVVGTYVDEGFGGA